MNCTDDIINNIKTLIDQNGVKQSYVAEKAGFTEQSLSNILCKRKTFKAEYVVPISKALGVTPNDLFEHNGNN